VGKVKADDVYNVAGQKLFNAYRRAFAAPVRMEEVEPPPIDDLWDGMSISQVDALRQRVGDDTVQRFLQYMRKKRGGQW
jgi:hypothetical protein